MNASFEVAVVAAWLTLAGPSAQPDAGSALRFFAIADRGFIELYGDPAPQGYCRVFLRGEEVRFGVHLVNETGRAQPITPPDNLERAFDFRWLVRDVPRGSRRPPYPTVRISLGGGVLFRNKTRDVYNPSPSSDVPRTRVASIPDGQLLRWDVRIEHSDADAAVVYDLMIDPHVATKAPQLPSQHLQFAMSCVRSRRMPIARSCIGATPSARSSVASA